MSAKKRKTGEETKIRNKYKDLKRRVRELEEDHGRLTVKLLKAKRDVFRLKTERSFIFEKLESVQQGDLGALAVFGDFMSGDEIEDVITVERPKPELLLEAPPQTPPPEASVAPEQEGGSPAPPGGSKRGKGRVDPNAPKRPANAFFHFSGEMRGQLKEEHGESISRHDMTRLLGQKWKSMPEENKKRYYDLYEKDKRRYASELNAYQCGTASTPDGQADARASPPGTALADANGYREKAQSGEGWMPTDVDGDGVAVRHAQYAVMDAADG